MPSSAFICTANRSPALNTLPVPSPFSLTRVAGAPHGCASPPSTPRVMRAISSGYCPSGRRSPSASSSFVQAAVARSSAAAARSRWMECLFFISGCLLFVSVLCCRRLRRRPSHHSVYGQLRLDACAGAAVCGDYNSALASFESPDSHGLIVGSLTSMSLLLIVTM